MKMKHLLLIVFAILISGCKAGEIDFKGMKEAERKLIERQNIELVIYMSLETMFPDERVRALAEAAGKGKLKRVEELVAQGVDINSRGTKNATPLFWTMRSVDVFGNIGNVDGFGKLLELGADPNILFADGSVMHWAALNENINFLRLALKHGGDPNLKAGQLNETPLFSTLSDRRAARILLLDSGADINAVTSGELFGGISMGGHTPVMAAAAIGRFDTVYELLNRGADYELKDDSGRDLAARIALKNRLRYTDGSEQKKYLEKVIAWLSARGVSIPD